jgi:nucleotidyltransferase/DNA polymerase involved in DNA repair
VAEVRRWILHVDLDQFIAAVEVLRRPELRGLPVVVGGDGDPAKRGVVATASYEAREYGVHSGLPLRTAARRCPDAVFLPADREVYEAASAEVMAVLCELSPATEVMGWDEAFLAVETEDPEAFARLVQERVLTATQLACSVGIGENRLQAKLATGFGKPTQVPLFTAFPSPHLHLLGVPRRAMSPSPVRRRTADLPLFRPCKLG